MLVVDTNILVYLTLPGPLSGPAHALLSSDPEWIAPPLWRSEFRNVLAGYLRRTSLDLKQALQAYEYARCALGGREPHPDPGRVLSLVQTSPCSAYDCEYVALAEQLRLPLVTLDRRVLQAFPRIARPLSPANVDPDAPQP